MVQVDAVYDPRVVVRDAVLVVIVVGVWLQGIRQQRAAVEGCAESGGDGALFDVGSKDKWARAAAENVGCGWLSERSTVAGKIERVVGDSPLDNTPLGLGVHREGLAGVLGIDLINIGLEVAVEEVVVEHDAVVRAESSQVLPVVALDELVPACAIVRVLGIQGIAYSLQAVSRHAGDVLRCAGGVGEGQGDW